MMKRIYLLVLCTMVVLGSMWARQRSVENAEDIARTALLKGDGIKSKPLLGRVQNIHVVRSSAMLKRKDVTSNREAFYVCVPEQAGGGFVLVSADDRMPEVLGVSEVDFDEENIPENMIGYLQEYVEALNMIEAGTAKAEDIFRSTNWLPEGTTIEPLLGDIMYNQGNPYNQQCPLRSSTGTRPATGCVATAMAQLMRYHKWPQDYGVGSFSYTSKSSTDTMFVSYDFSKTKFDWDNMLGTYSRLGETYTGTKNVGTREYLAYLGMAHSTGYNITVTRFTCIDTENPFAGSVQMVLTDDKGNFLQPIGTKKSLSSLKYNSYYSTYTMTCSMPAGYPDGKYRMYLGAMYSGSNEWVYVKLADDWSVRTNANYRNNYYIEVEKKGNKFSIGNTELACEYEQKNADAVAQLMAACGASLSMSYGSSSSASTSRIPTELIEHFGYAGDAFYLGQSWCSTDGWHQRIQEELSKSRPMGMRGESSSGGGHSFVLDGFCYINNVPYYHINWGWGGSSNGYFLLTMLKPSEAGTGGSSTNYANANAIVLNIRPNDGKLIEQALGCKGLTLDDTTYVMPGGSFKSTVSSIQNLSAQKFAGTVYLCLYDAEGNMVVNFGSLYTTSGLSKNSYFTASKTLSCTVPTSVPYGNYTVGVMGISSNGVPTRVYNAYEKTLHVVDEDPSSKMPGKLRFYFETGNHTATVRRFSNITSANVEQYSGDIVINDTVRYADEDYRVIGIADSAFYECSATTSVTMSDHIQSIGKYAFYGCTALESIRISDSVTFLPTYSFSGSGLKKINIPESVTSIAMRAFQNCTELEEVTLPKTLTSLTAYAFNGCTGIKKIYSNMETPMKIASNVWKGVDKNTCVLYVPKGCIDTYKAMVYWKDFVNIEEIPSNQGDLNGDGKVDATDLTMLVNLIMDAYSTQDATFESADMNGDGVLNVTDLTIMVEKIMNPDAE